jgi:hypothetical protein
MFERMRELEFSFWKINSARRVELLWNHVKEKLGAASMQVLRGGMRVKMYCPAAQYHFDVTMKRDSVFRVFKDFEVSRVRQVRDGCYTVVDVTIIPSPLEEGIEIRMKNPPTVIKSHTNSLSIRRLSGGRIIDLREACLTPYRLPQLLKALQPEVVTAVR